MNKYSVIDIETTGGRRGEHKMTEIAIINIDGNEIVDRFSTLINPERSIPSSIIYLTGITNEMVEHAPKFYEVAKKIIEMTEGRIFVAHNVFFDYNFIKQEFLELGYQFKRDKLCTVRLSRKYLPGYKSYSLGKLAADLGIEINGRHRAMGDAEATAIIFKDLIDSVRNEDFVLSEAKKIVLPPHVIRDEYEALPEKIGVYYFYGKNNQVLYIGKSKNIKKRVTQHFRADLKRRKDIELKNLIAHIDYTLFEDELSALLFEGHEIKEKWPPYNTSMKSKKFTYGIKLKETKEGILFPKLYSAVSPEEFVFLFKSKKTAQSKIDNLYKSLLGELVTQPEEMLKKRAEIYGVMNLNQMIEKLFYQKLPVKDDFIIERRKTKSQIIVYQKRPVKLVSNGNEYLLIDDPQLKDLLWGYMAKDYFSYLYNVKDLLE